MQILYKAVYHKYTVPLKSSLGYLKLIKWLLLEINVKCFVFGPKAKSSTEPTGKQNKIKQERNNSQGFIAAVSALLMLKENQGRLC